jgi:hypothetical protein
MFTKEIHVTIQTVKGQGEASLPRRETPSMLSCAAIL